MLRLIRRALGGLHALFQGRRVERDLDDELQTYLDAAVERHLQAGMTQENAVRAARLELGSVAAVKDHVRDAGWESRFDDLWQDVRYAARTLRASPGFTAIAVLTLALTIGANTAIFSVVNGLLIRALPVAAPERLALLSEKRAIEQGFPAGWNYAMWDQIRQRTGAVGRSVAWTIIPERFDLSQGGEADLVDGLFVSGEFFQELGVLPIVGRGFAANEDRLGSPESRVAVISYGFWQRRFGGEGDIVGRPILVNRVPVTIVGVAPPSFLGPEVGRSFDLALPIGAAPLVLNDDQWGTPAGRSYLAVMIRLSADQTIESGTAVLRAMQRQLIEAAIGPKATWGENQQAQLDNPVSLVAASAGTSELRRQYSRAVLTVLVIALLVLLIACANIANLLLARSAARQRDLSVRVALGGPRRRLVQQLLVESLLLASLGATLGLFIASWASRALVTYMATWFDRVALDVSLDWRVVTFTAAVTVLTAVLFGAAPALRASLVAPVAALKDGLALSGSRDRRGRQVPMRGSLIVAQVALSLVLVIAAGLFIRTFEQLLAVPLGFDGDRVLVVEINASRSGAGAGARTALYQRVATEVATLTDVASAGASLNTPANRGVTLVADYIAPGRPEPPMEERRAIINFVTPGWFQAYGIAARAGRLLAERDTAGAPPVAVANEAFVRRFFRDNQAVGSSVVDALSNRGAPSPPRTIVGIVGNTIEQSLRFDAFPTLYLPLAQWVSFQPQPPQISLSVRAAAGTPESLARSVASTLTAIDPGLTFTFRPLAEQVDAARHQERLIACLSAFFGGLALLLAAIGLFGIVSSTVVRRRTEIGIRMALGAERWSVVSLAIRHAISSTLLGVAFGLVVSIALTRYLEAMLFGITPLDPLTFIAAPALLTAAALLACYLPARRATTIDPVEALRCE